MNIKKILLPIGLLLAITFFNAHEGWTQTQPDTKAPIITHSYAIEKGRYGTTLKVYIEADDPNGDMLRIATVVNHVGYGYYPTDWIFIKPQNQHHLIGYLQWNTFSSKASRIREWAQITMRVSIFDKAGNESNEVVFPFTFETGVGPEPQPPAPFNQGNIGRLGHITIDLIDPNDNSDSGDRSDFPN